MDRFVVFPCCVIADCAEQIPFGMSGLTPDFDEDGLDSPDVLRYTFGGLRADSRQGNLPLLIPVRVRSLPWGDYSLEGHETSVVVERKSLSDLFATFGSRRESFEAQIAAMNEYQAAAVVIEATWKQILTDPPGKSRLNPKTIWRTVLAWSQRYPKVSWWDCEDRRFAEVTTFRFLERFWRDLEDGKRG